MKQNENSFNSTIKINSRIEYQNNIDDYKLYQNNIEDYKLSSSLSHSTSLSHGTSIVPNGSFLSYGTDTTTNGSVSSTNMNMYGITTNVSTTNGNVSTTNGGSFTIQCHEYTKIHQNSFLKFSQEFTFLTFLPYPEFKNMLRKILLKIKDYEMKKSFLVQTAHLLMDTQIEYGRVVCERHHVGGVTASSKAIDTRSIETRTIETRTMETRRKELQTKKILDFMRFIKTMKNSKSKVNQQSKPSENTPDTFIQDSFQRYHFSNRIFLITRVLHSLGFDIHESMFLILLKSTMIHPDHFLLVGTNQHESTMIANQILHESDRLEVMKWMETRDNYLWKSIHQVEEWIKDVEATYTPSMLSLLIESYLSIKKWNTAFGKLMDAKKKANEFGGISIPDLTDLYTMVLTKCRFEKSPCLYIIAELRFEMAREGIVIEGKLGSALVQCSITAGEYSACAEILREWDPVKERVPGDEELRETLIDLFPNRKS